MGERFTVVFEGNVRRFDGNPFHADTPFGRPRVIDADDVCAERDRLTLALERLHDAADAALRIIDERRERGDFDHWESFSMGDLGAAIHDARLALGAVPPQAHSPQDDTLKGIDPQ